MGEMRLQPGDHIRQHLNHCVGEGGPLTREGFVMLVIPQLGCVLARFPADAKSPTSYRDLVYLDARVEVLRRASQAALLTAPVDLRKALK